MSQWSRSWADRPSNVTQYFHHFYQRGDGTVLWNISNPTVAEFSETVCSRTGTRLEDYWKRREQGILPTLPASANYLKIRVMPCSYNVDYSGPDHYYGGTLSAQSGCDNFIPGSSLTGPGFSPSAITLASDETYRRSYQKYCQRYSGMIADLGTFLGEAPEMIEAFNELPGRIRESLDNFSRSTSPRKLLPGGLARARKTDIAKAVSSAVLEWNFGVRPLLNDVKSLAEGFAHVYEHLEKDHVKVQASTKYKAPEISTDLPSTSATLMGLSGHIEWDNKMVVEEEVIVKLGSIFDRVLNNDTLAVFGVSASSVIPTAWELMRCSWLVDYVFPLGDFFATVSSPAVLGVDSWQVTIHDRKTLVLSGNPRYLNGTPGASWRAGASMITASNFTFSRGPWSGTIPIYTFKSSLSSRHWVNTLAFAKQQMAKSERDWSPVRNVLTDLALSGTVPSDRRKRKLPLSPGSALAQPTGRPGMFNPPNPYVGQRSSYNPKSKVGTFFYGYYDPLFLGFLR